MDDCLLFAWPDAVINDIIKQLSSIYLLEDQGTGNDYLGIRIIKVSETKTITMSQPISC
jgi:hypothetical protein